MSHERKWANQAEKSQFKILDNQQNVYAVAVTMDGFACHTKSAKVEEMFF